MNFMNKSSRDTGCYTEADFDDMPPVGLEHSFLDPHPGGYILQRPEISLSGNR